MCDSLFSDSSGLGLFFVLQLLLDIIDKQVPLTLKAGCFVTQMVLWKMPFHLRMSIVASSLRSLRIEFARMLKMDVSSSASWWVYSDPAILGYTAEPLSYVMGSLK